MLLLCFICKVINYLYTILAGSCAGKEAMSGSDSDLLALSFNG